MKKFFEKHDLFKLAGIVLLVAVLLTWLVGYSYYQSGTLVSPGITRAGLFDVLSYSTLGIYYFPLLFMFIIIVSGFYKFVGSTDAYDNLTSSIASKLEGKENIVAVLSIVLFAAFAGVVTDIIVLFAFIPFVISIFSKLKFDKVSGLICTFGAGLLGTLAATYSSNISGVLVNGLNVTYGYELLTIIILFVIGCLILSYLVINRLGNNDDVLVDPFAKAEVKDDKKKKAKKVKRVSSLGLVILLAIAFIILILGFIDWENAFGVTIFKEAYDWLSKATLFGHQIYAYILGIHDSSSQINTFINAFGAWDLIVASGFLTIVAFVIKLVYHIPFDKMLDEYMEGFKFISKTVFILMIVNSVLLMSVWFPTMPAIADKIVNAFGTNPATLFIVSAITSVFTVDFYYVISMLGSLFTNFSNLNVAALILQTSYGLIEFIAPTSIVLMLGLSCLDVKFKDYFKFIWKFLVAMLIVVIAIIVILLYV